MTESLINIQKIETHFYSLIIHNDTQDDKQRLKQRIHTDEDIHNNALFPFKSSFIREL